MLIEPPIEELIAKTGDKYKLSCLISKRAKELLKRNIEQEIEMPEKTEITEAAYEVYEGKVVSQD